MQGSLVLASASPRRRQILAALGVPFETIVVDLDEQPLPGEVPHVLAHRLACAKAIAGAQQFPLATVVGADTVVELDGESLGKPASGEEAFQMLARLRGRSHRVFTGVAVAKALDGGLVDTWSDVAVTQVWMRPYPDDEVHTYIDTGDPFDKAGSYAIQHPQFHPVAHIEGCFLNVVGLPLPTLRQLLLAAGETWPGIEDRALEGVCAGCTDRPRLALPSQRT
jgi:MAF protein